MEASLFFAEPHKKNDNPNKNSQSKQTHSRMDLQQSLNHIAEDSRGLPSTVPKQELAYSSKGLNEAQKVPTDFDKSVDRSEKQECLKTLTCIEYIGDNVIWVQICATLQFSISCIQPVDTLIGNV